MEETIIEDSIMKTFLMRSETKFGHKLKVRLKITLKNM